MNVLVTILGVIMVICGCSCMFTPLMTFLSLGYLLMILFIVYGIAGLVKGISTKDYGINFVFSIISLILGFVVAVVPGLVVITDEVLLYFAAAWFIVQGVVSIVLSIKLKGMDNGKKWILGIVLGILGILLGIYSALHPILLAVTMGILFGVYFIVSGIDMIVMVWQGGDN